MASGWFHGLVSFGAGVLAGVTIYRLTENWETAAALGGACAIGGVIITPDLDDPHPTHSHTEVWRGCGAIPALIWWLFWLPYTRIMARHRAFLSHFPVLSTIGRVGYLGTILLPILWIIQATGVIGMVLKRLAYINWGYGLFPMTKWVEGAKSISIVIPGASVWMILGIVTLAFAGLSLVHLDMEMHAQAILFGILICALVIAGAIIRIAEPNLGATAIAHIPLWGWMFIGLSLSDTLHFLADLIINGQSPIWI